jgi:hypothetical protein
LYHLRTPPSEPDELPPDPDELPELEDDEAPELEDDDEAPELDDDAPELDDDELVPSHRPVTRVSHPCPHVTDERQPIPGL